MSKRDRYPSPATYAPKPPRIVETEGAAILHVDSPGGPLSKAPPAGMWWNNIRRAWFTGPAAAPVMVDPQPPAPDYALGYAGRITSTLGTIPPAVKVSA